MPPCIVGLHGSSLQGNLLKPLCGNQSQGNAAPLITILTASDATLGAAGRGEGANWVSAHHDKHKTINVRQRPRTMQRTDCRSPSLNGGNVCWVVFSFVVFFPHPEKKNAKCNDNPTKYLCPHQRAWAPPLFMVRIWSVFYVSSVFYGFNSVVLEETNFHARRCRAAAHSLSNLFNSKRCPSEGVIIPFITSCVLPRTSSLTLPQTFLPKQFFPPKKITQHLFYWCPSTLAVQR